MAASDVRPPVRAVARVSAGTDAPGAPDPSRSLPRRRLPGRIGAVNVVQLVTVEAILVLALLVLPLRGWVLWVGVALCLLLLLATLGRSHGRWWSERVLLRWRFRRRSGTRRELDDDRRTSALRAVAPALSISTVEGPEGVRTAVASDGTGWFAVVEVTALEELRGDLRPWLPLDALARTVRDSDQPGAVVQVVHHRLPSPAASVQPASPCHQSYRELAKQGSAEFVSSQVSWVAVRLDAQAVAEATMGSPAAAEEAPVALAALVRRVARVLKRHHVAHQILDADGLLDALIRSLELEQRPGAPGGREQWTRWRSASLAHATFWLKDWPALRDAGPLLDRLGGIRATFTSTAVILEPRDDGTDVRCLVRVAAEPDDLADACAELTDAAGSVRARLFRLDGEQAPAAYASAPTGGGQP
jgi:type VII secretion protein EccE